MATHDTLRTQLEERLTKLAQRAGRIEADLRKLLDRDWKEQAGEIVNDEVLEGLDDMTLNELRQIRDAIRRLDDGSYGTCTACGQAIAASRLAALPATPVCVTCAEAAEGARS